MSDDDSNIPCYVAFCKCGCGALVFASVDEPVDPRTSDKQRKALLLDNARTCAAMIRKGFTIERRTVGEVRKSKVGCDTERKRRVERRFR